MGARTRIASLDIVRGVAALSVFVSHWDGWTIHGTRAGLADQLVHGLERIIAFFWTGGGIHPGVIAFIVLSGFCIHMPLSRAPSLDLAPGFWRDYARRRTWRIAPVYLVATLLGFIAALWAQHSDAWVPLAPGHWSVLGVAATLLGLTALLQPWSERLFLHAGNEPLSTVTREILLYATYPLFVWLRRKAGAGAVLAVAAAAYLLIVVLRARGIEPSLLHGSYLEFLLYWMLGAAAAESLVALPFSMWREVALVLVSGSACLAFSFLVTVKGAHVIRTVLFAVAVALLLRALVGWEARQLVPPGRAAAWFAAVGERSYSLYAVHAPLLLLMLLAQHALGFDRAAVAVRWLSLAVVFAGTELLYTWVERPAHRLARKRPAPSATTSSAPGSL